MIFTPILLLVIAYDGCEASLSAQFKMIRGGLNKITIENLRREKDLEYPGSDRKIFDLVREMWENYYRCLLQKKNQEKPEIRRLLAGQYTELACDICPRPFQNYEELTWMYKSLSPDEGNNELEYLYLTPELTLTTNKTLKIYNALENLAGLYVCYQNRNVVSVYILEVSKNDTAEVSGSCRQTVKKLNWTTENDELNLNVETMRGKDEFLIKLEGKHLQIYYQWSQWTECSACGRVGKKFKYGTCFVLSKQENYTNGKNKSTGKRMHRRISHRVSENSVEPGRENFNKTKNQKISKNSTSEKCYNPKNWEIDMIEKFSTGIPCASQYLPKSAFEAVHKLKAVKVLVKYCWEDCEEMQIFEVIDACGKLIEWANNTAGIYSVFQKTPQLPHDIERRTIEAEFGRDIIIQCPGTSFTNTPVTWRVNTNIIFPDIVANESGGRFTIDLVHRINIKKLRLKDSRIYSCWQKDKLVGTVHLNVEKKLKIEFNHHVILLGISAVIVAFLFVGSRLLTRELKMRKK